MTPAQADYYRIFSVNCFRFANNVTYRLLVDFIHKCHEWQGALYVFGG